MSSSSSSSSFVWGSAANSDTNIAPESPTYSPGSPTYSPDSPTYSPEIIDYTPKTPTKSPKVPVHAPKMDNKKNGRAKSSPIPKGTELTIIVPWAHIRTSEEFVTDIVTNLEWGNVIGVDFVKRGESTNRSGRTNPEHYKIFIHLGQITEDGKLASQHMEKGSEIKINHRFGFWKIQKSKWKYQTEFKKKPINKKPKIEFL